MQIIRSVSEMKAFSEKLFREGTPTVFVPTMGYLHEGHASLFRRAKQVHPVLIASIFINPIQFNSREDFEKYPRSEERDLEILKREGVNIAFLPPASEVYPQQPGIRISYPALTEGKLCGATRPGHFEGVLHIVHNLFLWTKPAAAVFGEKDYQQFLLIARMAQELDLGVTVYSAPTIRESDGLAMSSRNARLSASGRREAIRIFHALSLGKNGMDSGSSLDEVRQAMLEPLQPLKVEYADIFHPDTLTPLQERAEEYLLAVAAWVDGIRLIDNFLIRKPH